MERLVIEGDRAVGVIANGERIDADDIVLATNAYTPRILPDLPAGAIVRAVLPQPELEDKRIELLAGLLNGTSPTLRG